MKSVLISIQPYWVFLIIAHLMGWNIPQEKTVEVRKDFPKASDWNKRVHIYCSKNRKSFNRIPKEYQPFMEKFLGRVIGEFMCDKFDNRYFYIDTDGTPISNIYKDFEQASCLKRKEIVNYILSPNKKLNAHKGTHWVFGWYISDLKIYGNPKELGEFRRCCPDKIFANSYDCSNGYKQCKYFSENEGFFECNAALTRPFQSWGYIEEL